MMFISLIFSLFLLLPNVDCQFIDGAAANRPHTISQARVFDLPKFAPTARIIKLSRTLGRGKRRKGEDDPFRDAAGSFDNFEAFDLETLEPSSGESSSTRNQRTFNRKEKTQRGESVGSFFPEST